MYNLIIWGIVTVLVVIGGLKSKLFDAILNLFNSLINLLFWLIFSYWFLTHPAKVAIIWHWLWN